MLQIVSESILTKKSLGDLMRFKSDVIKGPVQLEHFALSIRFPY